MKTTLLATLAVTGLCAALAAWHMAGRGPESTAREAAAPSALVSEESAPSLPPGSADEPTLPNPHTLVEAILEGGDAEKLAVLRADFGRSADAAGIRQLVGIYGEKSTTSEQRARLLETLQVVINPMAAEALREVAFKAEYAALKLAAIQALAKTGTLEAVMALHDLYRQQRDEQIRVRTLDLFRNCDPLPETRGLLQTLSAGAASDPWCLAASELLARIPEPATEQPQLGVIPQLTPMNKLGEP